MSNLIKRLGDHSFCLKGEVFHVDSDLKAETAYNLTERAAELYLHKMEKRTEFKTIRFTYAGRKWKIVEKEKEIWHSYILNFLHIVFFHKPPVVSQKEFTIESAWFAPRKHDKARAQARRSYKKVLPNLSERHNYQALSESSSRIGDVTPQEYREGVREKISASFDCLEHYSDPYTRLATFSFERLEPHLRAESKYRIILKDDELLLVHRKSPLATDEAMNAANDAYHDYLNGYFGCEKMNYIKHLIKLKKDSVLTPELVYRINCCTTNLEIQDVKEGISALKQLAEQDCSDGESFIDFAKGKIPGFLAIGVVNNAKATVGEFKTWVKQQEGLEGWLKVFFPSESELDRAFTGKKIIGDIKGAYSCGQYDKFKPWMDQQELTQTFQSLKDSTSFESYLEKLTHIVVKKHLARKHPTENLRVGALIPAPPAEVGGEVRWYYVTSCLSNEYNYSYTLESVCNDPTLPVIKLCRNTSPSSYAVYSSKSIINDLNLLNSPGYMGVNMLDEYEEPFFKQRTIPVWVGYLELAKRKWKEGSEVHGLLKKANEALARAEKPRTLSFREILKKHDVILNELYLRNEQSYNFDGKNLSPKFLKAFKKLIKRYINVDLATYEQIKPKRIQAHRDAFKDLLESLVESEDEREKYLITSLIEDLTDKDQEEKDLQLVEEQDVRIWIDHLEALAKERKEDLASKQAQSVVVTGQSLGGALSQVLVARHYSNKERMPLPGLGCTLAEFDAPAINAEDNQRFMAFGNDHKELLKALEIKFNIFRRQEVGDVAPCAGEEHLGAVYSQNKDYDWLTFDAALNKRSKKSLKEEIATAQNVHDTRFLEGKNVAKGAIVIEGNRAKRELSRDKTQNYDYTELKFSPHIQGIFDSHGKTRSTERKIYNDLYHNVWRLPRFKVFTESFRKSTDYVASCIRRLVLSGREKDRTLKTNDLMRRVAVHHI